MNDKQLAIDACNGAYRDRLTKAAAVFADSFAAAEGQANAAAQRQSAADRFLIALRVNGEAHQAALALVNQAYPESQAGQS